MSKGNRQDGLEREMSALPEGVGLQTCQIYFKVYSKGNRYLLSVLGVKQIWRSSIDDKRGSGGSVSNYSGCFHDNHTCIFFFFFSKTSHTVLNPSQPLEVTLDLSKFPRTTI